VEEEERLMLRKRESGQEVHTGCKGNGREREEEEEEEESHDDMKWQRGTRGKERRSLFLNEE
jgi:hypothetical protein